LANNICNTCPGNTQGGAVSTLVTATCSPTSYLYVSIASATPLSCNYGYYLSSYLTCASCATSTALKATDGVSTLTGQANIIACISASSGSNIYVAIYSITCAVGYMAVGTGTAAGLTNAAMVNGAGGITAIVGC